MLIERLTPAEQALYEILTDPVWFGEFLRSTNDFAELAEERKQRPFKYRWYQKDLLTERSHRVSLRGGRAVGKCHPKTTRVYTFSHGYMSIAELIDRYGLESPFLVYTPTPDGTLRAQRAWVYEQPPDVVYRITTACGDVLECSPTHPVYTDKGWVLAEDVTLDHKVAVAMRLPWDSTQQTFTWYELRWMGYMFANDVTLPESEIYLPYEEQVKELASIAAHYGYTMYVVKDHTYRLIAPPGDSELKQFVYSMDIRRLQYKASFNRIPELLRTESLSQLKVFMESYLSRILHVDEEGYAWITLAHTYVGQRTYWKDVQEVLRRFGVRTVVSRLERDTVVLRTYTTHDTAILFTALSIPGFSIRGSLIDTKAIPHFVLDDIVSIDVLPEQPLYAIEVYKTQIYIANNVLVHNSVVLQDKLIYLFFNARTSFPETREALLLTPNQNQLTPILDSIRTRFYRSPLLNGRLYEVNLSRGVIDFQQGSLRYRLHTRIAGSKGENNVVGLHVPRIFVDEVQILPPTTWTQLQPVLNHWEKETQLFIAGVPNGVQDSVLSLIDKHGKSWKKYAIPAPENPFWTYKDHVEARLTYGGETSDDFKRLVLGQHGDPVFSVIHYDKIRRESYPFYSYVYTDMHRLQRLPYQHVLQTPRVPHMCSSLVLAIDTGYTDPTIIQLIGLSDHVWRTYARWKLVRIPFNEQALIIHMIASAYSVDAIAIDLGAGGGGLGIMNTMHGESFPNNDVYRKRMVGVHFAASLDMYHGSATDLAKVQAKSAGSELLTQLILEQTLVFSQLDTEGIDQLTRLAYQRAPDGSNRYYIMSPRGGKSSDDHIYASYVVFTIYLIQHAGSSQRRIRQLVRSFWV